MAHAEALLLHKFRLVERELSTKDRTVAEDMLHRCHWAENDPLIRAYHDTEWGVPIYDSRLLWETLMLEGFQVGLSWQIILRKREAFRRAFRQFDPEQVARFGSKEVDQLMADPGIVRARIYLAMQARGEDFGTYAWSFTGGRAILGNAWESQTELSVEISRDLKRRGFKFVGPTIVYAWMQAVKLVNGHVAKCF